MDNEKKKSRQNELDSFWDISALLPQRKAPAPRRSGSTETVEISIDIKSKDGGFTDLKINAAVSSNNRTKNNDIRGKAELHPSPCADGKKEQADENQRINLPAADGAQNTAAVPEGKLMNTDEAPLSRRFIPPHTEKDFLNLPLPDTEYTPQHPLIHKVRIFNRKNSYNYYEQFLRHARKIKNIRGREVPEAPYFSYVPQYSQLSRTQLAWYLWWRQRVSAGEYKKTDYSYILLYIYEIINTGGHGNPQWGQSQLVGLWRAYRGDYYRLDRLLGEWICDYSLIYQIPAPDVIADGIPAAAVQFCALKEFYMASGNKSPEAYSNMLITYCSNYEYKNSKFAKGDEFELFDKHIRGALSSVVRRFSEDRGHLLSGAGLEDSHIVREAFAGALCSYEIKKKLEIDYCSFSRTHELRFMITDIIKYSENRIRAYLGIKSRLGVYALTQPVRECIDAYFEEALPKRQKAPAAEQRSNDYDRFYDAPSAGFSPERAAEIEKLSWETTGRLVEAFADDDAKDGVTHEANKNTISEPVHTPVGGSPISSCGISETGDEPESFREGGELDSVSLAERLGDLMGFVCLAAGRDYAGQRQFARAAGMMPELVADKINESAAELIGDIILREEDGGYSFIEDYRKEVFND